MRFGLGDSDAASSASPQRDTQASQFIATRAFDIGQNTLDFVVSFFITLYLAFFLLRDGAGAVAPDRRGDSARTARQAATCSTKFTTVIRATVKGNILVAMVQGALGGLAFWYPRRPWRRCSGPC